MLNKAEKRRIKSMSLSESVTNKHDADTDTDSEMSSPLRFLLFLQRSGW